MSDPEPDPVPAALVLAWRTSSVHQLGYMRGAYDLDRRAALARGDAQCAAFCAGRIAALDREFLRRGEPTP